MYLPFNMLLYYLPVVLFVVYYGFFFYFTRTFNYWKKRNVAGPQPIAFFGNIKESALRRKNYAVLLQDYYNMFPKEKTVGIYRMTTPCLLLRDLDVIKHVMIKDFDFFKDRGINFSNSGLGQNMFHADSETWSALRSRFTPIFTSGKLKSMFYLINECSDMCINHLEDKSRTNLEYDVRSLVQRYTISSIFACAFGVNFNNFQTELDGTLQQLDKLVLTPNFALEVDMMYPGLLKKLNLSLFPASVSKFFYQLVEDITTQRQGKPSGRGDFMDLILQLREMGEVTNLRAKQGEEDVPTEITNDVIAAQAFVFYVGGYETSSSTMTYLLHLLALNPEVQDKILEEIDAVTKAHGLARGEITYESLHDMKYLEKSFLETLRMYPIGDFMQRKAGADYKIPGTDVVVKKGQMVLVSATGVHYDKNYYPKPEVFDPHRFDSELVGARHPCAYLPFGVGPRNCIGMRFGALQSRLCIAKILSKFQVEASENTKASVGYHPNRLLVTPLENIVVNIKPRKF